MRIRHSEIDTLLTMSKFDELLAKEEQMSAETFRMIEALPGAHWQDEPEVSWLKTDVPQALYNGVFLMRFKEEERARKTLTRLRDDFLAAELPFTVHQTQLSSPDQGVMDEILTQLGGKAQDIYAIFGGELPNTLSPPPPTYQAERVSTQNQADLFCAMMTEVFSLSPIFESTFARWYRAYGTDESLPYQSYLYSFQGTPVGISAIYLRKDETLGTAMNFGVLPAFRSQKHGTIIFPHIVQALRERGATHAVTSGTPAGMQVYRKYGVQEFGWCRRWEFFP